MVAIGFLHLPRWITLQILCTFTLTWIAISNDIYSIHLYVADVSFKSLTFSPTNTRNSTYPPPDTGVDCAHVSVSSCVTRVLTTFFPSFFSPPLYFNTNQLPKHMVSDWWVLKVHVLQQTGCWLRKKKGVHSSEKRRDTFYFQFIKTLQNFIYKHTTNSKNVQRFLKTWENLKDVKLSPTISMFRFGFLLRFLRENNFTDPSFFDRVDRGILIWGWKYPFDPLWLT